MYTLHNNNRDVSEEEFNDELHLVEQEGNEDDGVEVDAPLFSFQLAPDDTESDSNDDYKYKLEIVQEDVDFVEGLVVNTRLCTRAPDEVLSAADAACSGDVMTKSVSTASISIHHVCYIGLCCCVKSMLICNFGQHVMAAVHK
jgi:hypothetical protein